MNDLIGKINGVDFWMILSLIIFGLFFLGVLVHLLFLTKKQTNYLRNIPFTENETNKSIDL